MIRRGNLTYQGPLSGHLAPFFFETDGTNNPSVYGSGITKVERVTSDGASLELYRVTIAIPLPLAYAFAESLAITHLDGDDLRVVRVTDALVSTVPADPVCQFDVGVIDESEAAGVKLGYTNQVAAGHKVSILFFLEAAPAT